MPATWADSFVDSCVVPCRLLRGALPTPAWCPADSVANRRSSDRAVRDPRHAYREWLGRRVPAPVSWVGGRQGARRCGAGDLAGSEGVPRRHEDRRSAVQCSEAAPAGARGRAMSALAVTAERSADRARHVHRRGRSGRCALLRRPIESSTPPSDLVRPPGFEPGTCGLRVRCSAVELEARMPGTYGSSPGDAGGVPERPGTEGGRRGSNPRPPGSQPGALTN